MMKDLEFKVFIRTKGDSANPEKICREIKAALDHAADMQEVGDDMVVAIHVRDLQGNLTCA